jgi:phage gp45-like
MDGAGNNYKKVVRSRNGVKITLDDQNGQEKFIAETPGGQKITLQDGPGSIDIADSNGNFIKLETSGVTVNAASKVTVTATQAEISASVVTVNAPMATFSGTVQAQTVICTTIISASYMPGAGNIW